jgi:hypothetical protein
MFDDFLFAPLAKRLNLDAFYYETDAEYEND